MDTPVRIWQKALQEVTPLDHLLLTKFNFMRKLLLLTTILSLSSCAPVGVISESAYVESTVNTRTYTGCVSYDVDPKELQMR